MKSLLIAAALVAVGAAHAQTHSLKPLWQTDSIVAVPESVLADAKQK